MSDDLFSRTASIDVSEGFIYVFANPAYDSLFKIGKTGGTPYRRMRDLSKSTSTPDKFFLIWAFPVIDRDKAERIVHETLSSFRYNKQREYFYGKYDELCSKIQDILDDMGLLDKRVNYDFQGEEYDLNLMTHIRKLNEIVKEKDKTIEFLHERISDIERGHACEIAKIRAALNKLDQENQRLHKIGQFYTTMHERPGQGS